MGKVKWGCNVTEVEMLEWMVQLGNGIFAWEKSEGFVGNANAFEIGFYGKSAW